MWWEICQDTLALRPTYLFFRSKIRCNFHYSPDTGGWGLCCSPVKDLSFRQPTASPDYHTVSPLSYEPLGFLMVQRLISLGGWLPSPQNSPYLLDYYWNGIVLTLTIHSNILWLLIITSYQFIDKAPPHLPPPFLLSYAEELSVLIVNYCFQLILQPVMA